jgi:predicted RNase H-like nuclease
MQQEELQSADSGAQRHGTRAQEVFPDESVSSLPSPASRCVSAKSNNAPAPSSSTLCFACVFKRVLCSRPFTAMTDATDTESVALQSPVEANRRYMQRPPTSSSVSSDLMNKSLVSHFPATLLCF